MNVIIGAGLAGLSVSYHLGDDYLLLEKENRVGGLCRTEFTDGFGFDYAIHVLYTNNFYIIDLIKNKLLGDNLLSQPRSSWIFSNGVYTRYPFQANIHGLPVKIVKECLLGAIKARYENNNLNPNNFEEWIYFTFGEGIAKHFMIPYNKKQWGIDLKKMTNTWIKDRVVTLSLDEIIEGSLTRQAIGFGPNAIFWYPKERGIESLPEGFLKYIDKRKVKLNTSVSIIMWKKKRLYTQGGLEYKYKKLIPTLPLPYLTRLMEPAVPLEIQRTTGRLVCNRIYAVNLAVRREHISDYHWVYFPEEKYLIHRISFPKNFSASMVRDGWSSITVEVSASKHRKIPKLNAMVQRVIHDLRDTNILKNNDIVDLKSILVLNPAYVIYTHTHKKDVAKLHEFLHEIDIFPCGRFGEWKYFNMDDSILSGKEVAETI